MPRGDEPDFLLVSCTGNRDQAMSEADAEKMALYKARGETALRNSGLGYTIIRPGALKEEPGGQKALVFDQGGRITQVMLLARWATPRARCVTLRARWVTLRARWVTLRARWVTFTDTDDTAHAQVESSKPLLVRLPGLSITPVAAVGASTHQSPHQLFH